MYSDAYADAIRPEQIERAIAAAVLIRYRQPHLTLEDCVCLAVSQVFCPCVSRDLAEGNTATAPLRTGVIDDIVDQLRRGVCSKQTMESGRPLSPGRIVSE